MRWVDSLKQIDEDGNYALEAIDWLNAALREITRDDFTSDCIAWAGAYIRAWRKSFNISSVKWNDPGYNPPVEEFLWKVIECVARASKTEDNYSAVEELREAESYLRQIWKSRQLKQAEQWKCDCGFMWNSDKDSVRHESAGISIRHYRYFNCVRVPKD